MNRDAAIALMLRLEGGYVNNPKDPGGATKYGITQRTLNSLREDIAGLPEQVNDLTVPQASAIYQLVQWEQIKGDQIPGPLAVLMLNAAINMGAPTAAGLLQQVVGVTVDRNLGPGTLAAVAAWRSPYMPDQTIAEEFAAHVAVRYAQLEVREDGFELGWFRRLFRVYTLAISS